MPKAVDITDRRFGHLVAVKRVASRRDNHGKLISHWLVRCDCGRSRELSYHNLRTGRTNSCASPECEFHRQLKSISTEMRAKRSAAYTGRKLSPEHRAAISSALKGHKVSAETRAKISAANEGPPSPEQRARLAALSAAWKGRKHSAASRAKMSYTRQHSAALKAVTQSPSNLARLRAPQASNITLALIAIVSAISIR